MDELAVALGVFRGRVPGVLSLSTLLDGEVGHRTHRAVAGRGDARAATSRPDSRRVPNLRTRHFHVASRFRVAQLGVQKQKADWGGLPFLFHCAPPTCMPTQPSHVVSLSSWPSLCWLPVVPHFRNSYLGRPARGPWKGSVCAGCLERVCSLLRFPRVLCRLSSMMLAC